jgi:hypothetical protein
MWLEAAGSCQVLINMKKTGSNFIIIAFSVCLLACSESREVTPDDLGAHFYPLEVGSFTMFQVDGVEYINAQDSTVFSYQMKESVVDSFRNDAGGLTYRIVRAKRTDWGGQWLTDSVWTVRKEANRVIRTEGNQPLINLIFQLRAGVTWDANGFNDREQDLYKMVSVREPFAGDHMNFDQSVTVVQEELADRIVRFISKKEVYSENVGLVYKENVDLVYKQGDDLGLEIVDSGIRYFQSLMAYGQE